MRWTCLFVVLLVACAGKSAVDEQTLTLLSRYHAESPDDPAVLYLLARVHDRAGDVKATLGWLRKLEAAGFDDALEPGDFPKALATADGEALAERLARRARVVVRSEVARKISGVDLMPEGHAYDAKRRRVLISSGKHRKVVAVDEAGLQRPRPGGRRQRVRDGLAVGGRGGRAGRANY